METIREDVRSSVRNLWHELRDREIMRTLAIVLSARVGCESSRELPATVYIVSLVKFWQDVSQSKAFDLSIFTRFAVGLQ